MASTTAKPTRSEQGTPAPVHPQRGYSQHKGDLFVRLRRIEGQVRGLQRMVEQDVYCIDILTQVAATTRALEAVGLNLLEEHLRHCVRMGVEKGGPDADAVVDEAARAVRRMVRS